MTATVRPRRPPPRPTSPHFRRCTSGSATPSRRAVHGKRGVVDLVAGGAVRRRARAARGRARHRQDHAGPGLAQALGGQSRRIQFTPDLLPSDVTGTTGLRPARRRDPRSGPGPVFANVVLADEINRAAAKTQSALLEVMEERTVTVDGVAAPGAGARSSSSRPRTPIDLDGTYRLPEAQLDRFLIRTSLGYPDAEHEIEVLRPGSTAGRVADVPTVTSPDEVAPPIRAAGAACTSPTCCCATSARSASRTRARPAAPAGRQHPRAAGAGALPAGVRRRAGPPLRRAQRRPAAGRAGAGPPHGAHPRRRRWPAHARLGGARRPRDRAAAAARRDAERRPALAGRPRPRGSADRACSASLLLAARARPGTTRSSAGLGGALLAGAGRRGGRRRRRPRTSWSRREVSPPVVVRHEACAGPPLDVTGRRRAGLVRVDASDRSTACLVPVRAARGRPRRDRARVPYPIPTPRRGLLDGRPGAAAPLRPGRPGRATAEVGRGRRRSGCCRAGSRSPR